MSGILNRRRRYFIKASLQSRYLRVILLAAALPAVLLCACLYYLIFYLMEQQLGIPESIAYNLIPVVRQINLILLFGLPLIVFGLFIWSLFIFHRIAGPVYRLERELEEIARGDFSRRIKFRRKDELASVARGINKVLDKVEERLRR